MTQVRLSDVVEALVNEGVSGQQLLAIVRHLEQHATSADSSASSTSDAAPPVIVSFRRHPRTRSSVSIARPIFQGLVRATGSAAAAREAIRHKAREAPPNVGNRSAWVQTELAARLERHREAPRQ